MKQLLICHHDRCEIVTVNSALEFCGFQIVEGKQMLSIQSHPLHTGEYINLNEYTFLFKNGNIWSRLKLKPEYKIGRNKDCDLVLDNELVSHIHARIFKKDSYWIEDTDSTNGMYINGIKSSLHKLKDRDRIVIVNTIMIFIEPYLIINENLPSCNIEENAFIALSKWKQEPLTYIPCEPVSIEIESFIGQKEVHKQKLFQSVGSSMMILLSSCLSCTILYFMNPDQMQQIISMMLMSFTMAFAFLAYGLYNRNLNYSLATKEIQKNEQLYSDYLSSLSKQCATIIQNKNEAYQQYVQTIMESDCEIRQDSIPVQWIERLYFHFQYHKPNYQQMNTPQYQILQNWITENNGSVKVPVHYESGKYWIQSDFEWSEGFFQRLNLIQKEFKVVWVGKNINLRFLANPMCLAGMKRLWIYDDHSLKTVLSLVEHYDVIYLVNDPKFIPCLKGTVFYISNQIITEDMDERIEHPIFYPFLSEKYDSILKSKIQHSPRQDIFTIHWDTRLNLKVCVGHDEYRNPIYLDLSEKGNGPHGLVAGSTGSGKSEWLCALLLQCICQNSPKIFQFILIDFKGGAFGQIFTSFPHFSGMITNLDEDMDRFIQYLDCFVKNRQMILQKAQCNHVDAYNEKYVNNPLAHILIVVDEFAQLKTQGYELLIHIKQLARIGRSLGIHLILSTQKPMGVIDDQIWANSNYQVCLKVQSFQDSKEVIHSPLASELKRTGQFYLRLDQDLIKGDGLYVHSYVEDKEQVMEVNDRDEILNHVTKKTYLESIYEQISRMKLTSNYLIPPELKTIPFKNELGHYEDIINHKIRNLVVNYGEVLVVMTGDISKYIHSFFEDGSVYGYRLNEWKEYLDENYEDMELLWNALENNANMTLLLRIEENLEQWQPVLFKPNCRIIIFLHTMKAKWQKLLESCICLALPPVNTDDLRLFFMDYAQAFRIRRYGILKLDQSYFSACLNPSVPKIKVNKKPLNQVENKGFFLGKNEEMQRVYASRHRPLLICYIQKSCEDWIVKKVRSWKEKYDLKVTTTCEEPFNICVCYLIEQSHLFQSSAYLTAHYDWQILWVGQGAIDYSFMMKRKLPVGKGPLIYWEESEGVYLQWDIT